MEQDPFAVPGVRDGHDERLAFWSGDGDVSDEPGVQDGVEHGPVGDRLLRDPPQRGPLGAPHPPLILSNTGRDTACRHVFLKINMGEGGWGER